MVLRRWLHWRRFYLRQLLTRDGEYELRLLRGLVPRDKIAIDIGANLGIYSYHLSRYAHSVVAFEANPGFQHALELLPRNVTVNYVALSSSPGRLQLNIPVGVGGDAVGWATLEPTSLEVARHIEVPVQRLDDFDLPPVGFIKVDVEGHEMEVLRGSERIIQRDHPTLLVEAEDVHKAGVVADLFKWATSRDYQGWFFERGRRYPISEFNLDLHQSRKDLMPGQKIARQDLSYVNNFLFTQA